MPLLDKATGIKRCSNKECSETNPCNFHKARNTADGLNNACRACQKLRLAAVYRKYKEKIRARNAAWEKANPGKVQAKKKRHRSGARFRETSEIYKPRANEIKRKAYRNPGIKEKRRAVTDAWIAANPDKKLEQNHRRRASKESIPKMRAYGAWPECLEYFGNCCAYCGKGDTKLEKDHFIPISKKLLPADMDRPGHVPWNIVPACTACNRSKLHREPLGWINEMGHWGSIARIIEHFNNMRHRYQSAAA